MKENFQYTYESEFEILYTRRYVSLRNRDATNCCMSVYLNLYII